MNQILQVEKEKKGPIEIHKVAIFFAIACIIFGIILVGQGVYSLLTKDTTTEQTPLEEQKPNVNIDRTEDNLILNVVHTKAISEIVYRWNNEQEQTIEGNDQTSISEEIHLPFGTNTLYLTIIDSEGNKTEYVKEYVLDGNGKPVIELLLTKENQIRIKVQDSIGLKYIRYTWNNGNYATVEANIENLKLIDELVDIPLGQNTLRVEAVNTKDIISNKELEVRGVRLPVVTLRQDGNYLVIRAEDEEAMKIVKYTLNGQSYQINFGEVKVIEYRQELQQGENKIELQAENKDGGIREIKGICTVQ